MPLSIVIASMTRPVTVDSFFNSVKETFPQVSAGVIADGFGCANYGFIIEDGEHDPEFIANQITMALMPARYSNAEGDPMLVSGKFYDARVTH